MQPDILRDWMIFALLILSTAGHAVGVLDRWIHRHQRARDVQVAKQLADIVRSVATLHQKASDYGDTMQAFVNRVDVKVAEAQKDHTRYDDEIQRLWAALGTQRPS